MGNLKQTIILERQDESGVVVDKKEQDGRSFLVGFINQLYTQHSSVARTPSRTWLSMDVDSADFYSARHSYNLRVSAEGGNSTIHDYFGQMWWYRGHELGIQVGQGTLPVSSYNYSLGNKMVKDVGRLNQSIYLSGTLITGLAVDGSLFKYTKCDDGYIRKTDPISGAVATSWAFPNTIFAFYGGGLACDGSQIWIGGRANVSPYVKLYKYTLDGSLVATYNYSTSTPIWGLAWDGKWLILSDDAASNNLHHISPTNGAVMDNIPGYLAGSKYWDLCFDNGTLWAMSQSGWKPNGSCQIFQMNPTTGTLLFSTGTPITGSSNLAKPRGLCIINGQIWVGESHSNIGYIYSTGYGSAINIEYENCQVKNNFVASNPNANFSIERYFTNKTTGTINITEVGIYAGKHGECISRDVVVPAIALPPSQILKVEYVLAVTV